MFYYDRWRQNPQKRPLTNRNHQKSDVCRHLQFLWQAQYEHNIRRQKKDQLSPRTEVYVTMECCYKTAVTPPNHLFTSNVSTIEFDTVVLTYGRRRKHMSCQSKQIRMPQVDLKSLGRDSNQHKFKFSPAIQAKATCFQKTPRNTAAPSKGWF